MDELTSAMSLLSAGPLCMVAIDPATLKAVAINSLFEEQMGPLFKFCNYDFSTAASEDQVQLQAAIRSVVSGKVQRSRIRDIEMTTLAGEAGLPVCKRFDWFISKAAVNQDIEKDMIIIMGDASSEQDVIQREKDAELVDYFQNAPIALHWLSGEGIVLWANQTELNVLGYTAQEYIGQPVMNFCPDEKELVLEIFQQLGSGNAVKDVPVRFRTKQGKIVHLLIDSNVKYAKDGSFGHTRCFIRDDTGRKIKEARATLLLEETKRSLKMLDNFMGRTMHHMRTPLHVTQHMIDAIAQYTQLGMTDAAVQECQGFLTMAAEHIASSTNRIDDISDLAKFDQGSAIHLMPQVTDLEKFGRDFLESAPETEQEVKLVLELDATQPGPSMAIVDTTVLVRVLTHLIANAASVTVKGNVTLKIGYCSNNRLTFIVSDTGPGLEMAPNAGEGDLPTIFQRYHMELLPEETNDIDHATRLRDKIEQSVTTYNSSGLGIGLSLSYHLVQALGGELRCNSSEDQGTVFSFALPLRTTTNTTVSSTTHLASLRVVRKRTAPPAVGNFAHVLDRLPAHVSVIVDDDASSKESVPSKRPRFETAPGDIPVTEVAKSLLASAGCDSEVPPSILVVEDTKACAKMLCRTLTQFNCSVKWAQDGKQAVDILREATPGTYSLIMMDLRMPVMDGLEAAKIIKNELNLDTPVVALTGDSTESVKEETKDIGFDAFFSKPMNRNVLKDVIKQFTGYEVQVAAKRKAAD